MPVDPANIHEGSHIRFTFVWFDDEGDYDYHSYECIGIVQEISDDSVLTITFRHPLIDMSMKSYMSRYNPFIREILNA
jgi:hypothetical protein